MNAPVLAFAQLDGGYGDTCVLRGVSGQVHAGQVLGVIGRNGVGKTTLVRLLSGELRPMSGDVLLNSQGVQHLPPHQRQRMGLQVMPQEGLVFDPLSVRENLTLHRADASLHAYAALFKLFPRMRERLDLPAGRLSGGEKKLVAFARTLAMSAPVLVLDEPTEGVQQENIARMASAIAARCAQGTAFIIVEQNLAFLSGLMDQVLVLDHGDVVLAGPAAQHSREELLRHLQV
jgi:ABC-type branched-subunit amino acid transport system ATPase component